jgi:hypothetical protein
MGPTVGETMAHNFTNRTAENSPLHGPVNTRMAENSPLHGPVNTGTAESKRIKPEIIANVVMNTVSLIATIGGLVVGSTSTHRNNNLVYGLILVSVGIGNKIIYTGCTTPAENINRTSATTSAV